MNGPGIIRPRQRQPSPVVPSYTIITVGQRCVGKSSLLRLLLDTLPLSPHATHDQLRSVANFVSSPGSFCECHLEILWHNERLLLHLIDTPPLNGRDTLTEIISLVEERYIRGAHTDSEDGEVESHVHLCLYLLDAFHPDFRHDINAIARLSTRVNVLPVLARSDLLTLHGLVNLKHSVRTKLADAGLGFGIFDKQGEAGVIPTRHSATENPPNLPLLPYAIFTPEDTKLVYEPVLNIWMDKLNKRRADWQSSSDMPMDVDRKMDESLLPSSLLTATAASLHLNVSPSPKDRKSPPTAASEPESAPKSDPNAASQTKESASPFSTTRADADCDKARSLTPPMADSSPAPSVHSSSSPQPPPLAPRDNSGTARIKLTETGQQHQHQHQHQSLSVPNAEDSAPLTQGDAEPQDKDINYHSPGRSKTAADRPLSASSPQNGFHAEVKVSPSIKNILLNPKISPAASEMTAAAPCYTEQMEPTTTTTFSNMLTDSELILEKFVRVMRFGVLDCVDSRQSDFVRLRDEIMAWRKELKGYTRDYLYRRFKDDSFSRLAAQAQAQQQQPSSEHSSTFRHETIVVRDCAYRASSPLPPSLQHGIRGRSTSFTEPAAERDRPPMSRSLPQHSAGRDQDSYAYERERDRDLGHRYPYHHDRPRDKYLSPEMKEYHAAHLSPHAATIMPMSNERKHSISNGDRDRHKYRDPKHELDWEEQQQQRHPVLPSMEQRGDRYPPRVSPISHVPPPSQPPPHCHPNVYPQYSPDHVRDKDHFERERGRERIPPSTRECDVITSPLQRPGSPGAPIGMSAGQGYGSNMANPNISPSISSSGKQLDVHSLLNHNSNNHHGAVPSIVTQGLDLGGREKEWERSRELRDRDLSPNSATMPPSGMSMGMPISNMQISSGGVVGPGSSVNSVSPSVPNAVPTSSGRKRKITMACNFCRSRKLKCDGFKPACGQCTKRGNNCDYQQHAVVAQGPPGAPRDIPVNSSFQSRDHHHHTGQPNSILPPTHINSNSQQLTSPGIRHRERDYEIERDGRDTSFYHSGRPYSPPPPPPPGSGQSHGHSYPPQQGYSSSYSSRATIRDGTSPPQHHVNAHSATTHTWRYTSQSHAQAHAAATRDSDVDELIEDLSEHEDRSVDMRLRGMRSNRDFTTTTTNHHHVVYEQHSSSTNGSVMNNSSSSSSTNGRGRVSVDMLIVEALGEEGSNGLLDENRVSGSASIGTNGGRNRGSDGHVKDGDKAQLQHASLSSNQSQPPSSGPGGHYEAGSWYEMSVGVIDVGSEGDKKKRLNRQSANYGSKAVACVHCRARKTRCDAVRPACGNCARRSLSCSYNHMTPSQPRSKGKKAAAAAAAAAAVAGNSNQNSNSTSTSALTPDDVMDHDIKFQRTNISSQHPPNRSRNHSRSPGQIATHPPPPNNWHNTPQSHQSHQHQHSLPPHPPPPAPPSSSSSTSSHSPIRADDHRLPIEESAERERPLTRSPQPPIATLNVNVPERSRSRSSSSGSLSTSLMDNPSQPPPLQSHDNRVRSTSNFIGPNIPELAGVKRKSPDVAELLDTNMERGIILDDQRNRERPDKRRKPWVENGSGDATTHLSSQVRVQ